MSLHVCREEGAACWWDSLSGLWRVGWHPVDVISRASRHIRSHSALRFARHLTVALYSVYCIAREWGRDVPSVPFIQYKVIRSAFSVIGYSASLMATLNASHSVFCPFFIQISPLIRTSNVWNTFSLSISANYLSFQNVLIEGHYDSEYVQSSSR